jgi:type VI secretion system protein VasG
MAYMVEQCKDPDSGGRMVDNIITNTVLPELSREVLSRMVSQTPMTSVEIVMKDGKIGYDFA